MFQLPIEYPTGLDLDQRDERVRALWTSLYRDYISYLDEPEMRESVSQSMEHADPDDLITSWVFVLFTMAHKDFKQGERKGEREFVVSMQSEGIVAFDPQRQENVYLHTA